jgi:hypothetical protein
MNFNFISTGASCLLACRLSCLILLLTSTLTALAEPSERSGTAPSAQTAPIQDNSFLIEEAYNQEPGVIQHINTLTQLWMCKDWVYSFTEEWPVPGHSKSQLSYTMSIVNAGGYPGSGPGPG